MGCCSGFIRVLLFIFNVVFWLIGLALLAIGIWLLVDLASRAIRDVLSFYGIAVYIIIAAGAITTVVGFLGCCGAWKNSKCLLVMFSVFLGIIFVVEVAAGIVAIVQRGSLSDLVTDSFADIFITGGNRLDNVSGGLQAGIKALQTEFECCGLNDTDNWNDPSVACACPAVPTQAPGTVGPAVTNAITSPFTTVLATTTSVVMGTTGNTTTSGSGSGGSGSGVTQDPDACVGFYKEPCGDKLKPFLESSFLIVGVAALVFSIVQIIGICFSCIVIKSANDVNPV